MGHLVISRRISERVFIGDDVEIMISDIHNGKVELAINAPSDMKIHRKESHVKEERNKVHVHRNKHGNSAEGH